MLSRDLAKRVCHRVETIAETRREIGKRRVLYASHYSSCKVDRFNPCGLTSSGERFRPNAPDNAASPIYPDGTKLLVWNPSNGKTVVVRINNGEGARNTFVATLILKRTEIDGASLAGVLLRHPLITLKITAGIHWQAFRLWLKGCPIHAHPKKNQPSIPARQ